jgi:predicted MFS family arabinose efflux permease
VAVPRRKLLTAFVAVAVALAFADSSVVVLALPDVYRAFDTSIVGVSWVITSYNLVVAVAAFALVPVLRRVDVGAVTRVGLAVFCLASVGAAASWNLPALIVFRCVQGLGAALLLAGSLALLSALTGSAERGLAVWTAAGTLGAAVGPALGGVLTQLADWRAIFAFQAPVALIAFVAAFESHLHPRAPGEERGGLAANVALALLFGALVGALFLAVLLVITVWGLEPAAGAAVVSALPLAALGSSRLARLVAARVAAATGAGLLAAGLVALALLPSSSPALVAAALALCGAGLGLAVPVLTQTAVRPDEGVVRRGTITIGARHAGLVVALALVAPLLSHDLTHAGHESLLGGTRVILDGNAPLRQKVPIALDLRTAFEATPNGSVPNLAAPFDRRGAAHDAGLRRVRDDLVGEIRAVLTRGFRNSFLLSAVFALAALVPILLARRLVGGLATARGRPIVRALLLAAATLLVAEVALGGVGYGTAHLADPCTSKPAFQGGGLDGAVQRFALSGLAGAACSLGTSREELVLSFSPSARHGAVRWNRPTIEKALRAGLDRASHDTVGGGLMGAALAFVLRELLADPVGWFLGVSSTS